MNKFYAILPLAMATLMAAGADNSQLLNSNTSDAPPQNTTAQPSQQHEKNETLSYRQRMVTGKVMDVKEADVTAEGKKENHFLVKLTTVDNNVVVVDLGPRAALKNEVKAGDEIAAFGISGRLNQRPLIVASKFATITPIEGRDEIFEAVPVSYDRSAANGTDNANSNQRFSEQALQKSNDNQRMNENRGTSNGNQAAYDSQRYDNRATVSTGNSSTTDCGCR